MIHHSDWEWWKEKLHDFEYLDSLTDAEVRRLMFCCFSFIVHALEPEKAELQEDDRS